MVQKQFHRHFETKELNLYHNMYSGYNHVTATIRREIKLFYIICFAPKLIEYGGRKGQVWRLKRVSLLP